MHTTNQHQAVPAYFRFRGVVFGGKPGPQKAEPADWCCASPTLTKRPVELQPPGRLRNMRFVGVKCVITERSPGGMPLLAAPGVGHKAASR